MQGGNRRPCLCLGLTHILLCAVGKDSNHLLAPQNSCTEEPVATCPPPMATRVESGQLGHSPGPGVRVLLPKSAIHGRVTGDQTLFSGSLLALKLSCCHKAFENLMETIDCVSRKIYASLFIMF